MSFCLSIYPSAQRNYVFLSVCMSVCLYISEFSIFFCAVVINNTNITALLFPFNCFYPASSSLSARTLLPTSCLFHSMPLPFHCLSLCLSLFSFTLGVCLFCFTQFLSVSQCLRFYSLTVLSLLAHCEYSVAFSSSQFPFLGSSQSFPAPFPLGSHQSIQHPFSNALNPFAFISNTATTRSSSGVAVFPFPFFCLFC